MMSYLYNFLSFFLIIGAATLVAAQDVVHYPKQILNLSSDVRVATNALLADKSKRQLSLVDSISLSKGLTKELYNIDIGKNTGDKKNDKKLYR